MFRLWILIVLALVGASSFAGEPPPSLQANKLAIEPSTLRCQTKSDCEVIQSKCGCDCGRPVNKKFARDYRKAYGDLCKNYSGEMCKLKCDDEVVCVQDRCGWAPKK